MPNIRGGCEGPGTGGGGATYIIPIIRIHTIFQKMDKCT